MPSTGWGPKILLAAAWSCGSMLLLSIVDSIALSSGSNGGSVAFLFLGVVSTLIGLAVVKLQSLAGARAIAIGSLLTTAGLVPCMVRAADLPLVEGLLEDREKIHSGLSILAIGAIVLSLVLVLHTRFERQQPTASDPLKPDYLLIGTAVVIAVLSAPLFVSSIRHPSIDDVRAAVTHAEMTVPALDSAKGDTIPIFDDDHVTVSASRTQPLPLRVARLELDLHDGVGPRPVVAVGGGEHLRLVRRGPFIEELCHVAPPPPSDRHFHEREPCVPLARFMKGRANAAFDPRVSVVRGRLAPPPGFVMLAIVAVGGAAAAVAVSERQRRKLLRIAGGQEGLLSPDGTIESLGLSYAVREPPAHNWPGPVVILDVAENADPYRGTRAARSVVPGTIPQHVAWHAHQRLALHAIVGAAFALAIASLATAWYVGYAGF